MMKLNGSADTAQSTSQLMQVMRKTSRIGKSKSVFTPGLRKNTTGIVAMMMVARNSVEPCESVQSEVVSGASKKHITLVSDKPMTYRTEFMRRLSI